MKRSTEDRLTASKLTNTYPKYQNLFRITQFRIYTMNTVDTAASSAGEYTIHAHTCTVHNVHNIHQYCVQGLYTTLRKYTRKKRLCHDHKIDNSITEYDL